ncbi:hypothetical protein TTHERM_00105310 (macronuclear) [Tetrahymena thermophila SB210]|uniref:Uncharacterized protein n=1 Tax=Tetrahymena thermophila (strain SB210) TaxID=312017 RepID=Q234G7_TETTS|nr:hypothetical protein TTHERM_00105310 [Tetrahymena thermophila SB210]EAR92036.1 hypothetical protein TTHERM_00105310 [Tetrahymena thermophila SB210]|eukprot:XP_001012281.1 hypothetical protein TTHERM_00105310 [Tetrahymena thermophila SB210]
MGERMEQKGFYFFKKLIKDLSILPYFKSNLFYYILFHIKGFNKIDQFMENIGRGRLYQDIPKENKKGLNMFKFYLNLN